MYHSAFVDFFQSMHKYCDIVYRHCSLGICSGLDNVFLDVLHIIRGCNVALNLLSRVPTGYD